LAPEVTAEAKTVLSEKKNLRILVWPKLNKSESKYNFKSICGGFLLQTSDLIEERWSPDWILHGQAPKENQKSDLLFALRACAHLKSNAIAIAKDGQSLGFGMGQVNRVDAVEQAIRRWKEFHPKVNAPVLAGDAFFPFADSMDIIAKSGIEFVIQPGGSIKDDEVIAAAKAQGINMIFTGRRHFRH
jgi:phosphoribosylaminoimidazolecarboxamide formyltransferase/IMP cyclohydrolase